MFPNTFVQFLNLPLEIRLQVWEETWPEPRIIEAVEIRPIPPSGHFRLKPTCTLSSWIDYHSGLQANVWRKQPSDECPDPIALRVCRESRAHTLSKHIHMRHSASDTRSFFYNPRRDLFWPGTNTILAIMRLKSTRNGGYYSGLLDRIEMILVDETRLDMFCRQCICGDIFELFTGLQKFKLFAPEMVRELRSDPSGGYAGLDENELGEASAEELRTIIREMIEEGG